MENKEKTSHRLHYKIPKEYIEGEVIFDAGTGVKSVEFLVDNNPKKIFAVSHSKDEIQSIKDAGLSDKTEIEYLQKDITDEDFELEEKVDVIFAGYFFSALQGSKPFQTLTVMEKFKEFLKEDGLIIIDEFYWEDELKEPQDVLCRRLWNLKDGLKTILDIPFPKQFPSEYIKKQLEVAGYKIIQEEKENEERANFDKKLERYKKELESVKKYIERFEDSKLKSALNDYTDNLFEKIKETGKTAWFASDYLIIAKV